MASPAPADPHSKPGPSAGLLFVQLKFALAPTYLLGDGVVFPAGALHFLSYPLPRCCRAAHHRDMTEPPMAMGTTEASCRP
jgi:hypothetical protein